MGHKRLNVLYCMWHFHAILSVKDYLVLQLLHSHALYLIELPYFVEYVILRENRNGATWFACMLTSMDIAQILGTFYVNTVVHVLLIFLVLFLT